MASAIVSTPGRTQIAGIIAISAAIILTILEDELTATLLAALATVSGIRQKLSERRELSADRTHIAVYAGLGSAALLLSLWHSSNVRPPQAQLILVYHLPPSPGFDTMAATLLLLVAVDAPHPPASPTSSLSPFFLPRPPSRSPCTVLNNTTNDKEEAPGLPTKCPHPPPDRNVRSPLHDPAHPLLPAHIPLPLPEPGLHGRSDGLRRLDQLARPNLRRDTHALRLPRYRCRPLGERSSDMEARRTLHFRVWARRDAQWIHKWVLFDPDQCVYHIRGGPAR